MELRSIYQTYRPQRWSDVVGQELIVRTLTNEIAHDTLVHAYLFTGTRGVGKTTTARLLAKTVNCEKRKKGDVEPCNTCAACVAITEGRSLDVMEIDAASHTGVDNVRENIIATSRVASLERKCKVFIIDEVHMLSTAAFNALLKTLEEPSSNVLFILATTDSDRVPDTIISRCQRFDFRRVSEHDIIKRLSTIAKAEGIHIGEGIIATIVRAAQGSIRDAESMFGQLVGLGKKKITEEDARSLFPQGDAARASEFVTLLLQHDGRAALALVDAFITRGGDVTFFLDDCIRHLRSALTRAVEGDNKTTTAPIPVLANLLRQCVESAEKITLVHPPELILELLIAEYAHAPSVREEARVITEPSPRQKEKIRETEYIEKPVHKEESIDSPLLSLALIHERWQSVLSAAKKHNHSLALILKVATPVAIAADILTVGFRYSFHADRLEDRTTKKIACRILQEIFGTPLDIRTTVVQADTEPPSAPSSFLNDIVATFGGKVVKKAT